MFIYVICHCVNRDCYIRNILQSVWFQVGFIFSYIFPTNQQITFSKRIIMNFVIAIFAIVHIHQNSFYLFQMRVHILEEVVQHPPEEVSHIQENERWAGVSCRRVQWHCCEVQHWQECGGKRHHLPPQTAGEVYCKYSWRWSCGQRIADWISKVTLHFTLYGFS